MSKILIIGQAPPYQKQRYPYDSTLLYDILSWVGVSVKSAQDIFDFDALVDKFPGFYSDGSHQLPSKLECDKYWATNLSWKFNKADKIIVLGNIAKQYIQDKCLNNKNILYMIHPSKRNSFRINSQKDIISRSLYSFIYENK